MKLSKFKLNSYTLSFILVIMFSLLYICVGFVSTLHSITFFQLANNTALAILLGVTYEIGQATILFSILSTRNKDKFLPWVLMFLLTALQISGNVYASFKFMVLSGSNDWMFWQKSILIGVQAANAETYQVIISWISGALLPIVALGLTALVSENLKMMSEEPEILDKIKEDISNNKEEKLNNNIEHNKNIDIVPDIPSNLIKDKFNEYSEINKITDKPLLAYSKPKFETIQEPIISDMLPIIADGFTINDPLDEEKELKMALINFDKKESLEKQLEKESKIVYADDLNISIDDKHSLYTPKVQTSIINDETYAKIEENKNNIEKLEKKSPIDKKRGWHLKKEYIDSNGDIYEYGEFKPNIFSEDEPLKKV